MTERGILTGSQFITLKYETDTPAFPPSQNAVTDFLEHISAYIGFHSDGKITDINYEPEENALIVDYNMYFMAEFETDYELPTLATPGYEYTKLTDLLEGYAPEDLYSSKDLCDLVKNRLQKAINDYQGYKIFNTVKNVSEIGRNDYKIITNEPFDDKKYGGDDNL